VVGLERSLGIMVEVSSSLRLTVISAVDAVKSATVLDVKVLALFRKKVMLLPLALNARIAGVRGQLVTALTVVEPA